MRQSVNRAAAGVLDLLTSVITGYWALRLMFQSLNGGAQSWWPTIMLGASILLLAVGVYAMVPRLHGIWLVIISAVAPLILCAVLFQSLAARCWLFGLVMAFSAWGIEVLCSALKKRELLLPFASLILAASWTPLSVNTLRLYFSSKPPNPDPMALFLSLSPWLLIVASFASGTFLCRSLTLGVRGGFSLIVLALAGPGQP